MNAKKLLLSLLILVTCFFCYSISFDWCVNIGSSFSAVRISDSFNLEAGKDFSFKTGAKLSQKNAVFASCSVTSSEQLICFYPFKTPGDTVEVAFCLGYSRTIGSDYLLFGTGLDLLFSSSCITKLNCLLNFCQEYDRYVKNIGKYRLFFSIWLKEAYANGFCCASSGLGCCIRGE